ncbi:hypothetical protein [Bacillus thuringiensis]|uniref:Uncharacterized protein n=1 Tax=Bacillus thuringiensis TaxID=1428 RepID=A0A9X6VED5_BACTU|nr:hypothetical protein [Bacillus thuringiensis]MEC3272687.1 hypothetical protein [Bacillus thuringiensis]PFB09169.1 hypothetical protein CN398_06085 [Bacillus thuringiensis]
MFYREATEKDFEEQFQQFDIPDEIKSMILGQKKVDGKIVQAYRNLTGEGMMSLRNRCNRFLAIVKAYDDFTNGKKVYTDY